MVCRLSAGAKGIRTIGPAKMEQRFETPVRPFGTFPSAKKTDASGERDRRFESPSLLEWRVGRTSSRAGHEAGSIDVAL